MASKLLIALSLFSGASAARPTKDNLSQYSFAEYEKDFQKHYSAAERVEREAHFLQRKAKIMKTNAAGLSWTENVNEFTDISPAEIEGRRGIDKSIMFKSRSMPTGNKPLPKKPNHPVKSYPNSVDWRNEGVVTPVKNQGQCGSCWTFGATEALESHVAIQTGILFTLSEQQFASCVEDPLGCGGTGGCEGATMELAYQYGVDNGLVSEWAAPYTSYTGIDSECLLTDSSPARVATITGYEVVESNSYEGLMDAIIAGPVAITVDASVWHTYDGGIFDGCDQENPDLDHGVLLVGYGTDTELDMDYWLIRNSWGPAWGEKGYLRIARTSDEGGLCGTDVNPSDGVGCAGGPANVTVCGTCGILYDASYPTGGALV